MRFLTQANGLIFGLVLATAPLRAEIFSTPSPESGVAINTLYEHLAQTGPILEPPPDPPVDEPDFRAIMLEVPHWPSPSDRAAGIDVILRRDPIPETMDRSVSTSPVSIYVEDNGLGPAKAKQLEEPPPDEP